MIENLETATKEQLIARIDELENILDEANRKDCELNLISHFGLSRQEAIILYALATYEVARYGYLSAIMKSDGGISNDHIRVQIHKIKKKTRIKAINHFGYGYSISKEDALAIRQIAEVNHK